MSNEILDKTPLYASHVHPFEFCRGTPSHHLEVNVHYAVLAYVFREQAYTERIMVACVYYTIHILLAG